MANKGKLFNDNDLDYPRITFQTPGRTFDRLLKESSLSDLKETIGKKLGLGSGSVVQFAQLRNGQLVDLEDEDDFDAFCALANKKRHANVQVVLTKKSIAEDSSVDAKRGTPSISDTPSGSMSSTSPLPPTPASDPRQLNGSGPRSQPGPNASPSQVPPAPSQTSINQTSQHPPPSTQSSYTPFVPNGPSISTPSTSTSSALASTPSIPASATHPPVTSDVCKFFQNRNWQPQMSPATQHLHQHPPHHPPSGPHTSGVPTSPRTHAPSLQSPGTPTLSHAAPAPVSHPPISHAPSGSMSSMSSTPPTPLSALPTGRLSVHSSTFVAGGHKKVVLKNEDGIEVNLETLTTKVSPAPLTRKRAPFRIETPEQRQKRLEEEQEQKEKEAKAKASPEERPKGEKEEEERRKEEEERMKNEEDAKGGGQFQSMSSFATMPSEFGQSVRFEVADLVSMSGPTMPFRNPPLQRTASQGGVGPMQSHRTRSKRGEKRSEASKGSVGPQARRPVYGQPYGGSQALGFEFVAPLQMTQNRWDRRSLSNNDPDSPEVVDRKVKALLNKLTMEKFDSISDQIIQWANRSENQKDGRTLIQVIRIVFEKATDEATWSEMYARLCRKMMEQISPKVQDEGIRNADGNPITGGQLFRKYILNRCQEDLERGWVAKEATAAAAATEAANETSESGEVALYSDEYFAAQKAKRQGLGLIKFIGKLFKLQMLTERIMHECIKKLLVNVQNPEEEEIESLCMLLTTVGSLLDNQKARAHLDIYFQRMQVLSKNVSPQMQLILQDLIELRDHKWQERNAVAAPTTIAQIHEAAAKEATQQRLSTSCGCSRRGTQNRYSKADRWNGVSRTTAQASDLSQFGRFSKAQPPTTLGPSSVFAGEKDLEREAISRTSSSPNMFSALQEARQESDKASEQPTKLVKEPPVSMFFSIRNLLVTFLQSIYLVPGPGTPM